MTIKYSKRRELPGRFQLGTEAWRDAAVAFMNKENDKVKKSIFRDDFEAVSVGIGDQPFSLCETFTNAPPHLGFKDNTSCFSLIYDGETFTASDEFNPNADMKVSGDYQAALFMAQVVGFTEPGRLESVGKQFAHTFGNALSVEGEIKNPTALGLINKLHDHLARRTVENPDLAHRLKYHRLVDNIKELEEQGYTVIERVISDEYADALREEILRLTSPMPSKTVPGLLNYGRLFEDLVQHPITMSLVDATLGRGAILGYSIGSQRNPGKGVIGLHSDDGGTPEPFPEWATTTNCLYALDDWNTESAGPTWIIPGSHKTRRQPYPEKGDTKEGGIPITMPKGSMLVMTSGVWHWQGDRTDPSKRVHMNMHYFRHTMRPHEPFVKEDRLLYRNPPRVQEVLGMDDGLDEGGNFMGRDYARIRYMVELNLFNNARKEELLN